MKINQLESEIILRFLADPELVFAKGAFNVRTVNVTDRSFTGIGFMTEFERDEALRLFDEPKSLRWSKAAARLNSDQMETGYIVYVDNGYLTSLEGFTYGGAEWPKEVTEAEVYDFDPRQ